MPTTHESFNPTHLTAAMDPDERLRLALIDHALGRMTAKAWSEFVPELIRDIRDNEGENRDELKELRDEVTDVEKERDAYKNGLDTALRWLKAHRNATAGEALIALADLDPQDGDTENIGDAADKLRENLRRG